MSTSATLPLKVFGVPFSVHTRKVILAARLKSIPYEVVPVVPVIPDNPPANWRQLSPTGLIPAIDDAGFMLADSTAITLYLERRVPSPALLPSAAEDYGRALAIDAWAGTALFRQVVHPLFHEQVVNPNVHGRAPDLAAIQIALERNAPEAFAHVESQLAGAFLVGGALSIADLAVLSNLIVFHYLGRRIASARYPKLEAYFRRQLDQPLLAGALAAERPFVEQMGLDRTFLGQGS